MEKECQGVDKTKDNLSSFQKMIRYLMEEKGLTSEEVGELLRGVSSGAVPIGIYQRVFL